MTGERWIVIPNWDSNEENGHQGFQHYKDRDPYFIKNYRSLLSKDEYLELTFHQRGVLHGLWLEYAASNRQIRDSTLTVTRRLGQRVTRTTLDALNHAGFIAYSASRPLAPRYPREEKEKEKKERAHARGKTEGAQFVLNTMIRNGAITDEEHLWLEIRAHGINALEGHKLLEALRQRRSAA